METKKCKCCGRELPLSEFPFRKNGESRICKECDSHKKKEDHARKADLITLQNQLQQARSLRVSEFTPRELMEELKRRGYEGTLTYTETHIIDLNTI